MFDRGAGRDGRSISINRREFIRRTGAAAVGAAALGAAFPSAAAGEVMVNGLPGIVFGRTGLEVTRIAFGGILITEPPVLLNAIDNGINLVHTSPGYQNGRSMEAFGKVFRQSSNREKVVFALKVRPGEKLDECLSVLNTDYADFLIPPMDSIEEISSPGLREDFEKAREAGKCGHMGFACHTQDPKIIDRMVELGFYDVILMSYAKTDNPEFMASLERARRAGIGIMAMKGLPKRMAGTPTDEERATYATLCSSMVGGKHAHAVLASMGSFQAVEMYRDILQTRLGYRDPELEHRYWAGQEGNYCGMCGKCRGMCPNGVEVADIVRFRMYNRDYGLEEYSRTKYASLADGCNAAACEECGLCESLCSRGLPLRRMLREAHSLLA